MIHDAFTVYSKKTATEGNIEEAEVYSGSRGKCKQS